MLVPSSGIGTFREGARLAIRFVRQGCTNRPFFHIVVAEVSPHIFSLGILTSFYSWLENNTIL